MISTYFGPPGVGKTTFAVKYMATIGKKYEHVLCNFPCTLPGVCRIDSADLGKYDIQDALIVIDEAGIDFSNREWKQRSKDVIDWLKKHRHAHCDIILLSQAPNDADNKMRDLSSSYFLLRKFGPITMSWYAGKGVDINQEDHQWLAGFYWHRLRYFIEHPVLTFTFRRHWYKYFDSWEMPPLPPYEYKPWVQI